MTSDPLGLEHQKRKGRTPHSLLEVPTTEAGELENEQTKTLSVSIVIKRDIRNLISGQKGEEKRGKDQG